MKTKVTAICLILLFISATSGQWPEYQFQEILDDNGYYVLRWSVTDTKVMFETTVGTTGYVGFGLSKTGLMSPADFVIGWIDNGEIYFGDYFTTPGSRTPQIDSSQDWRLQDAFEANGTTVFRFERDLDTCDPQDEKITRGTMQVIYSFHHSDPDVTQGLVPYHGPDSRGTRTLLLLERDMIPASYPPNNTFMVEIRNYGFQIPATGSRRQCLVHNLELPTSHMIKYEPVITEGNERFVYRMILYSCNITDMTIDKQSFECETGAPVNVRACKTTVVNWAIGTNEFHFPEDIGLPLGGEQRPVMYVLEIHYTNYELIEGIADSSGLRIYYTTDLRQYDAGLLELGHVITPGWRAFIPPGEEAFVAKSYCSPRCVEWGFPTETSPMKPFGVIFQGNDIAKGFRLRHFRGNQELPYIAEDDSFSNFHQYTRLFSSKTTNDTNIIPMDVLSLECTYNTTDRQTVTRGGWARVEEICRATLFYYPRKPIEMCLSWSSYDTLVTQDLNTLPEGSGGAEYFSNITDWNQAAKETLKNTIAASTERVLCSAPGRRPAYAIDRFHSPAILRPYQDTRMCMGQV